MLLLTDPLLFRAYGLLRPETQSMQEEPMMLNTTCRKVCQKYRVLGLDTANLDLQFSIPETPWAHNSGKFPDLGTVLRGFEPYISLARPEQCQSVAPVVLPRTWLETQTEVIADVIPRQTQVPSCFGS